MSKTLLYIILLLWVFIFSQCSSKQNQKPITIAGAASLQYVLPVLIDTFEHLYGIKCRQIIGSTGKLTTQIENGAPYDVFLSANNEFSNYLYKKGLTVNRPKIYALGRLILWNIKDATSLKENLISSKNKHIIIANPKMAPYGIAAKEVLENLNLYTTLQSKLIFAESISQVNQFLLSSNKNIGFTAKSSIFSKAMKNNVKWVEVPQKYHHPILQTIVILKNKKSHSKAKEFYSFLFSRKAKKILVQFGYKIPNE